QSNTSTPRFSPTRGDVRLEEIISQIDDREDLSEEEKETQKRNAVESAQTHSFTKSISTRLSKNNSDSKLLRNTVDGISLSYSQSDAEARGPTQVKNDAWRWSSSASY